jgi:hypothetical protein
MTVQLPSRKPRNPLIALALHRRAGAHRRSASGQRQRADRALRAELARSP